MLHRVTAGFSAILLVCLSACGPAEVEPEAELAPLYVVDHYDPARDVEADLTAAIEKATAQNKHILLFIGGEWCIWCEYLADFLEANTVIHSAFADSFVVMKVNFSPENKNEAFLGKYPKSEGYPDFFILDSDGTLLAQQGTAELELDRSYDPEKMMAFALKWKKT